MTKLTEYKKNGYHFRISHRCGDVALFPGQKIDGNATTWEVIHVQSHNGREIAGKSFPPAEFPPSNEQWGSKGWTYPNLDQAMQKFESELEKQNHTHQ